jgi:uncharacterized protein (TIGR02453 family)
MIQPSTLKFLQQLSKNNNKPWFDAHKADFDAAKANTEAFVTELKTAMSSIEPALGEQKAKDMIFRIYRDVRFSKDKIPYKDHFGAYMSRNGRKAPDAGYYLHIQPGKSFLAGGLWMPEGPLLKATRQEIDYNLDEFKGILNNAAFKKQFKKLEGEQLKTVPQGYAADNPAIEYLKMKSFIASTPLSDEDITSKNAVPKLVKTFTLMKPLIDFLNRPLD